MVTPDTPMYVISVAAELAGMHPQTLRQYDRLGLVTPGRTRGRGRRYSPRDIATLREVQRLSQEEGVNLAGIKRILELEAEVRRLQEQVERLRAIAEPGRRSAPRSRRSTSCATSPTTPLGWAGATSSGSTRPR